MANESHKNASTGGKATEPKVGFMRHSPASFLLPFPPFVYRKPFSKATLLKLS